MREVIYHGYERTILLAAWSCILVAMIMLGLAFSYHVQFSPFDNPGATPDDNRLGLLTLDGIRWALIMIAGVIAGMVNAPSKDQGNFAWLAFPIVCLFGAIMTCAISTGAWFYWMSRLPDDDVVGNSILFAMYLGFPTILLYAFATFLAIPHLEPEAEE